MALTSGKYSLNNAGTFNLPNPQLIFLTKENAFNPNRAAVKKSGPSRVFTWLKDATRRAVRCAIR